MKMTDVNPRTFARAWLTARLCSGSDADRPQLFKTVCVEEFREGLRLSATNQALLVWVWAPFGSFDAAPAVDASPDERWVVCDPDDRVRNLMRYAAKTLKDEDKAPPAAEMTLRRRPPEGRRGDALLGGGLVPDDFAVEFAGWQTETVQTAVYQGDFPRWAPMFAGLNHSNGDGVHVGPDLLSAVAQIGLIWGSPVELRSTGVNQPILLGFPGADTEIGGLFAPIAQHDPDAEDTPPLRVVNGRDSHPSNGDLDDEQVSSFFDETLTPS
jgi:hypothetical protein